jgi:hypothetical protein
MSGSDICATQSELEPKSLDAENERFNSSVNLAMTPSNAWIHII